MVTHWDLISLFFYIFCAFFGMLCFRKISLSEYTTTIQLLKSPPSLLLIGLWTIVATYRLVAFKIGGTDALSYIEEYERATSFSFYSNLREGDTDYFFMAINVFLRNVSSDYHLFFAVVYGTIAASCVLFVGKFSKKEYSCVPFFMLFFLYLRSFNTIRSVFAISLITIGLYFLANSKYRKAYLLFFLSVITHKASIVFALVIPLCHVLSHFKIKRKHFLAAFLFTFLFSSVFRTWFQEAFADKDMGGSYMYYVNRDKDQFWELVEFWGQYALGGGLLLLFKRIKNEISSFVDAHQVDTYNILLTICFYDIALTPFNALMGIWRGYEFFYIARMCMWSMIIGILVKKRTLGMRIIVQSVFFAVFFSWFVFRLNRTYEDSDLMPYIFEPLIRLL